ncbi:MAG: ABC transporter ATP-binding protein [Acidimicrobiales bacterium]|nr:ABC transporter ATP-binding protein [Acidimicrobiales bacterium]
MPVSQHTGEVHESTHDGQPDRRQLRPAEVSLRFANVSMHFPDGTNALTDVSFDVGNGELVAVVGPSGCGKTTLLRVAAGLETPTGGSVAADTSDMGYIFQDATLMDWRTVQGNVELVAELQRIPKAERSVRAASAIASVGLAGFEDHFPDALSGGMKMRVSLARSLIMEPSLFLFDEPFGAVDQITRETLQQELLVLHSQRRFAGLLVTHSVTEAVYLSSRVIVLSPRPGRVLADIEVPLPYPRLPELRFEPGFVELTKRVTHELGSER